MKKLIALISVILLMFILFIISIIIPKSYTYQYKFGNFSITEKYQRKNKNYLFEIKTDDKVYKYSVLSNYYHQRGLIKKIKEDSNCLKIKTIKINDFTVCLDGNQYTTCYYNDEINNEIIVTVDNIDIYKKNDRVYLIWNYNDFIYLNGEKNKKISLFENDIYELDIVTKVKDYLLVADYNQKYSFNKMFFINAKNGKVKEISLDRKVYFDSYILGTYKNNVYLFDNNKETEYVINPFKKTIDKNRYEILNEDKWESISINKLKKGNVEFKVSQDYYYSLDAGNLYYNTPVNVILVTNLDVARIIESNSEEIYFISGDTLYYADKSMITKVMSYSEWQFNNKNIYIF